MSLRPAFAAVAMSILLSTPLKAEAPDGRGYHAFDLSMIDGDRFQYMSGGGADRCAAQDCMCRASAPRYTLRPSPTISGTRRLAVSFLEGSHEIPDSFVSVVRSYLESFPQQTSFTIVGYTDGCGSHDYNEGLVERRVAQVRNILRDNGYSNVAGTQFHAEASQRHDPAVRRVDIIAHTTSRLTTMIDKVQADVYLIDASGSMWEGWKDWSNLVAVSFKPNSRIYLSQTLACPTARVRLDQVSPAGGTEIWYSYWKVLEWMEPGETLAIISDFRSDVPLTARESRLIQQKVNTRQIKVIAISP